MKLMAISSDRDSSDRDGPPTSPPPSAPGSAPDSAPQAAWWRRAWRRRRSRQRQDLVFFGIAAGWVLFDQITKVIVRSFLDRGEHWELASFFRFSHVTNDGAAFGLFDGANVLLAASTLIAVVVVGLYYLFPPLNHWMIRLGLALILGGSVGNLLDRLYQGSVTDFINFSHYPAFNVADSGIVVGVAAVILYLLFAEPRRSTPDP